MISVNQAIGTSVPENNRRDGTCFLSRGGTSDWEGVKTFKEKQKKTNLEQKRRV